MSLAAGISCLADCGPYRLTTYQRKAGAKSSTDRSDTQLGYIIAALLLTVGFAV